MKMSQKNCKHKWVDMEDGTIDRFCVKCLEFEKQTRIVVIKPIFPDFKAKSPRAVG